MIIPVRKCYQTAKIAILLLVLVTVFTLFEQWRGGMLRANGYIPGTLEAEYERQIVEDEARIVAGLGEGGDAVQLEGHEKQLGADSVRKNAMNVYLSDRIAYNRTLKDHRHPACSRVVYDAELPSVSVILIFHNEPYSVVIRTIWSVLNNARRDREWYKVANYVDKTGRTMTLGYPGQEPWSQYVYLKEIILVDDNSTLPELKGKLDHYIATRLPRHMIKVLRLPDRIGVTRAREHGARVAGGDVMVFLDSHCEGNIDWLRPLLQRIKDKPTAVLVPIIPTIEKERVGIPRARQAGASAAAGEVLVLLDSQCEGARDWMRPLAQRIKDKPDAVLIPIIDGIDNLSFQYLGPEDPGGASFSVGGFNFAGHFTWIEIPAREKLRRGSEIAPTWSPTMAGGLFAVSRAYFWQLGGYDEQMNGWGGENLEISFRTWMCGGTLETIPCSRVGHVFRSFHPYGLPAESDTHGINTARLADVWMDDYAELFYLNRPDLRGSSKVGDVTHRRVLREKLKCNTFQWYLDTVYPDKFVPGRNTLAWGRVMCPAARLCLDSLQRGEEGAPLGLFPCYPQLQGTQTFALSDQQRLRSEEKCAEVHFMRKAPTVGLPVLMFTCSNTVHERQKWKYGASGQIVHVQSGLCLEATGESAGQVPGAGGDIALVVTPCRGERRTQEWKIDFWKGKPISADLIPIKEQRERLEKIMGLYHSRKSRSLLSVEDNRVEEDAAVAVSPHDTRHRHDTTTTRHDNDTQHYPHARRHSKRVHVHKRKLRRRARKRDKKKTEEGLKSKRTRVKNKFMLKLVRPVTPGGGAVAGGDNVTAAPGGRGDEEDHLEVDIHCRHRLLYPNDTFVRDLVRILNDHDIKVINNGRVFERHRVADMSQRRGGDVTPTPAPPAVATTPAPPPAAVPLDDNTDSPPRDASAATSAVTSPDPITSMDYSDDVTELQQRQKYGGHNPYIKPPRRQSESASEEGSWRGGGGGGGGGERAAGAWETDSSSIAEEPVETRRNNNHNIDMIYSNNSKKKMNSSSSKVPATRRHVRGEEGRAVKFVVRSNITLNLGERLLGAGGARPALRARAPTAAPPAPAPPPPPPRAPDSSESISESRSTD